MRKRPRMVGYGFKCRARELVRKMRAQSEDGRIETQTWASIVAILASDHGPRGELLLNSEHKTDSPLQQHSGRLFRRNDCVRMAVQVRSGDVDGY